MPLAYYTAFKKILSVLVALGILMWGVHALKNRGYGLSYQVSTSMPKGWYRAIPITQPLLRGTWVFLKPPLFAKDYLIQHHWLPDSGIMLKSIQALPGDWVCVQDQRLLINQRVVAPVFSIDSNHQPIQKRPFCRQLAKDEYLVLGLSDKRSYDSRYFGPIKRPAILNLAQPLFSL